MDEQISKYNGSLIREDELRNAMSAIANQLNRSLASHLGNKYKVFHRKSINSSEIIKYQKLRGFAESPAKWKSQVTPDGGILWLVDYSTFNEYPILISELKYQKTNGSAIDRTGKYISLFRECLFKQDDIFPLVVFIDGERFQSDDFGSLKNVTEHNRLMTLNNGNDYNILATYDKLSDRNKCKFCSLLVKENCWTFKEMRSNLTKIAFDSLDYYLRKILY